jgi:DNA-binding transcriptional LysR family regulator
VSGVRPTADLVTLELFVSTVELGSLTRAADHHGFSQPAASNRIARLERKLGFALLERGPTGSRPTPEGRALTGWARHVLDAVRAFDDAAAGIGTGQAPHLDIVASPVAGDHLLPRWLRALDGHAPPVAVSVCNTPQVIERVAGGEVALGFLCVPGQGPRLDVAGLRSVLLGRDELVVAVRPDHDWARRDEPLQLAELAVAELVERDERSETRLHLDALFAPWRPAGRPRPRVELSSTGALKTAVLDGVGPAVLGRLTIEEELRSGRLVAVPCAGFVESRAIHAIWHADTALQPDAGRFLRYVSSAEARRAAGLS